MKFVPDVSAAEQRANAKNKVADVDFAVIENHSSAQVLLPTEGPRTASIPSGDYRIIECVHDIIGESVCLNAEISCVSKHFDKIADQSTAES